MIEDLTVGVNGYAAFGRHMLLDPLNDKVYWSTPGSPFGPGNSGGIYRANLDGTGVELFLASTADISGLDFGPSPPLDGPDGSSTVPEPITLAIWSILGGIGLLAGHRRRRRKPA